MLHTDQMKKNRRKKVHDGYDTEEGAGPGGLSKTSQEKVDVRDMCQ